LWIFPSFFSCFSIERDTPHHHHQILPTGVKSVGQLIKGGQPEGAGFQLQVVNDKTATFHVQHLHAGTGTVDENEHITVLHVAVHQVGNDPAQGVETLPHVRGLRVDVIIHRG